MNAGNDTYSLTGGDPQDLGGESDGTLNAELLVLCPVDQICRDWDVHEAHGMESEDTQGYIHFSRFVTLLEVRVILILCILAAGTGAPVASYSFSPLAT